MNWLEIVSKITEQDEDKIQLAPLSNIGGGYMKLNKRNKCSTNEYICKLTKTLDSLAKLDEYPNWFRHYILTYGAQEGKRWLRIKVQGKIIGAILVNADNTIIKITLDPYFNAYPDNVNELIQKFVGEVVEW